MERRVPSMVRMGRADAMNAAALPWHIDQVAERRARTDTEVKRAAGEHAWAPGRPACTGPHA